MDGEESLRDALKGLPGAQLQVIRHDGNAAPLCARLDKALAAPLPPTAFLVARSTHALTVTMHLLRRGLRIPQDVAVISRDDAPFLHATTPAIAHYAINPVEVARRVSMLMRQLAETGSLPVQAIRLMPAFVAGETV